MFFTLTDEKIKQSDRIIHDSEFKCQWIHSKAGSVFELFIFSREKCDMPDGISAEKWTIVHNTFKESWSFLSSYEGNVSFDNIQM